MKRISSLLVTVFASLGFLSLAGCLKTTPALDLPQTNKPVSGVSVPTQISKAEIAVAVEAKLRNTVYLEMVSTISQKKLDGSPAPDPLTAKCWMAKDAFKTLVYTKGKLIRAFSLVDGVVQEYSPERGVIDEYPAEYRNGIGGPQHELQTDCLIGNLMFSHVGVTEKNNLIIQMDVARSMRAKIDQGVQGPDMLEQGRDCYVFRQSIAFDATDKFENVVFVDKETMFVIRWDITRSLAGLTIERQFSIRAGNKLPQHTDWKIPTVANRSTTGGD